MKTITISQFLSVALLFIVLVSVLIFNFNKPRVMVLHSYNTDYSWTRDVNVGFNRIMEKWTNYSVVWHYMDTKKHNDEEWLTRSGIIARRAIDKWQPNVLIAVDNFAQELAAQHYINRNDISIVFAGINGSIEPYNYHTASNVTGILEQRQLESLRDTIMVLEQSKAEKYKQPATEKIRLFYIMDSSKSVLGDKNYIDNYDWQPLDYVGSFAAKDWTEWQQKILQMESKTDYLFVTNYRKLSRSASDPSFVPANEVMTWTEAHSPVPVIGLQVFNVEDGGMLSIGVSPFEQGEVAAKMAQTIIRDKRIAASIPVVPNHHFIVAMRKPAMLKRNLKLPPIYESFSRATNTYFE